MDRKSAREKAMQVLYQIDLQNEWEAFSPEKYIDPDMLKKQSGYVRDVVSKTVSARNDLDAMINQVSTGWTTGRMGKIDLAILRLAACEILYREDIPKAVSINEAVELAKKYGSEQSPGFINAILGKIHG